ncbi:MAG: DnaK suppressor protein [Myxococcota bacterium]|jgi:DnaK suppressor protein
MAEELTEVQLQVLAARLADEQDTLSAGLKGADERSATVELDGSMGRLSRIDALQHQEMAMAQARQAERRLKALKGALRRMETDDYGWCPDCGEPIGFKRLNARPEAPFCLACTQLRGG